MVDAAVSVRWRLVSLAVVAASVCGCSNSRGPKAYPAKGVVMVNGQPAAGLNIGLYHTSDFGTEKTIIPEGWTAEDGSFVLTTYEPNDGAPAGDYQVRLVWPAYRGRMEGPDRLQGKFGDPAGSGFTVHLDAKPNEIPVIQVNYPELLPAGRPPATTGGRKQKRGEK